MIRISIGTDATRKISVTVDGSKRGEGRGAYFCKKLVCFDEALRKGRLDRTLKANLTAEWLSEIAAKRNELNLSQE